MRHIKPSSLGVSLQVFLPLLWKGITSQVIYFPGYSIQVSPSVSVQEGLCVTIPCTFTADGRKTFTNSFGYWKQLPVSSDYIVATNDKSSEVKKTNFNLTGNPNTGDCTLTITGARKEDEGDYYFRFDENKNSNVKYNYQPPTTITVSESHPYPSTGITSQVIYPPGYSIQVSRNVSVQEGLCVTIPCTFTADYRNTFTNSFGYWMWRTNNSDYIVATNDKSSEVKKTNFNLTGNPNSGDCTLTITGARKEDEGEYYFRFVESKDSKMKYNYQPPTTITVPVSPSIPTTEDRNACSLDFSFIIGMVIGNIVALILIYVGSYFCLRRHMEKRQLEKGPPDQGTQVTESTYEELKGQRNDIYYNFKAQ
ncbi:sialic acid-binding Ig-like lectin 12 [Hyla sarda]|uniref:sialic acid-binding Ig-like lectin 12 n=1 Tax=Hyla sarda TaxID=327740 RepID=UPI0024C228C2|nr:sialic acid-binding Ig-like lectin 12 [Hyla sarda]